MRADLYRIGLVVFFLTLPLSATQYGVVLLVAFAAYFVHRIGKALCTSPVVETDASGTTPTATASPSRARSTDQDQIDADAVVALRQMGWSRREALSALRATHAAQRATTEARVLAALHVIGASHPDPVAPKREPE